MNTFAEKILVHEAENTPEETVDDEDSRSYEENKTEKSKTRSEKYATLRDATVCVAPDCNGVLTFL